MVPLIHRLGEPTCPLPLVSPNQAFPSCFWPKPIASRAVKTEAICPL